MIATARGSRALEEHVPRSLDQRRGNPVEKPRDEGEGRGLGQGLSARQLHEAAGIPVDLGEDVVLRALPSLVESVARVAPHAAQRAAGESHEHAGLAGASALALDGEEDLVDGQDAGCRGRSSVGMPGNRERGAGHSE